MTDDIRLYMFQTGTLKCKVHNIKMNEGNGADYAIPVPFFLLTHPKGHTIIDGGNAVECATDPRGHWGGICDVYWPEMSEDEGCVAQLEKIGVKPEDVKYVLQSHLHLDHTGAIGRFPNATHIVQRAEYEYAYTPDWFAAGGYIRKDFDKPGLKWQFLEGTADDHFDVYGDGSLITVFSPGHAPGHQSILVNLPQSGPMLLAIDAAYTTDHWEEKSLPGFLASTVDAVRSVQKLRALAEKTGATVVTGHDPDAWPGFKQAPEYYS
ncbi:AttM family quorum-quenching N-acyl homoserine lactonase [Mesobaculum littorinae]|nr:N-acyl homoserine lactonase family protein [Mesobaculum littorinae]